MNRQSDFEYLLCLDASRWGRCPAMTCRPSSSPSSRRRRKRDIYSMLHVVCHGQFKRADYENDELKSPAETFLFEGWGCEDTEFLRRIPLRRLPGPLFHIWHAKASKERFARNRRLLRGVR